ncbi:variant erythrocyte surface antigen-1 family protein [Babesia caballi]|uniref:Variant erythrocyte surface antigen-1 family protein n=1 Tax=Babesia caballi TaxID=5871 RepID=A0AAV4LMF0_BABCB|nr:variant erythrocyte surface antigen-1 family protein [Babesia caballi]
MGEKSLTQAPKDLKESIDWLALVRRGYEGSKSGGSGKPDKLEEALKQLEGFKEVKTKVSGDSLSHYIYGLAQALSSGFLGYNGLNGESSSGDGIVLRGESYTSAYHDRNWEQDDASTYAKIFLCLAPLTYYFITFLYWTCKPSGPWARGTITESNVLGKFFTAMGYDQSQLDQQKTGTTIANRLGGQDGFPELSDAHPGSSENSYDAFLKQLGKNYSKTPLFRPLTDCMRLSYAYLKSRHSGHQITDAIDAIKGELVNLSTSLTSGSTSSSHDFSKLTGYISTLLGEIQGFDPNAVPSPVAPLAGTLTTLTAAGGAGAAYGLNVFGFQDIVKALFGFK